MLNIETLSIYSEAFRSLKIDKSEVITAYLGCRSASGEPVKTLLSYTGLRLLQIRPSFFDKVASELGLVDSFFARRGETGTVVKEKVCGANFAVKRLFDAQKLEEIHSHHVYLPGFEYFRKFVDLQNEGHLVADPVLATENRFVTRWVDGKIPHYPADKWDHEAKGDEGMKFELYTIALKDTAIKLREQGVWGQEIVIDDIPPNFKIAGRKGNEPVFIAIDAIGCAEI